MQVAVVGAGIGGLTLALSLHAAGIDCRIIEAVEEIRPLGVGINLLPHAVRELTELGLGEWLAAIGIETQALVYATRHGAEIWREPRGLGAGYHWPQYSVHRGRLQMLLLEAVRERLGSEAVTLGHRVAAPAELDGDLIVACDGIHSTIRADLYPTEGSPIWNRRVLWRGVTEAEPYMGGATMVMAGHQDQKFVCYPIGPEEAARGRSLVNWIAELRFSAEAEWWREDWNRPGRLEDFLPRFEDWNFGWLDVPGLICGAASVYEYPMVDRDPLPRWTFGGTTLLGDAAHPMYPIGSNGASQAILDARTLAFELARHGRNHQAALKAYEEARRPPTSAIVLANRGNGPEQVMQMVHERAPDGFEALGDVISHAELKDVADTYKRLAGFDPALLNKRPSLSVEAPA